MHDVTRLESIGIPAVAVATTEFITAARAQAGALGRADYQAVFVSHPIQDQTADEIAERADTAIAEIVHRLTAL
ncbi:MAG: hypothetical protein IPJ07_26680 [Acidobacteria bacterium]|nr:hypothetical protein [Acidobacteriota bacterium]